MENKTIEEKATEIEKIMNRKAKRYFYYGIIFGIITFIFGFAFLMTFNHEVLNLFRYLNFLK